MNRKLCTNISKTHLVSAICLCGLFSHRDYDRTWRWLLFTGSIDIDAGNEVTGAYAISYAYIQEDGHVAIPE